MSVNRMERKNIDYLTTLSTAIVGNEYQRAINV
jgi:hypothetical protein